MREYSAGRMMSDKAGGLIRLGTLDGGIEYVELESDHNEHPLHRFEMQG